MKAVIIAALLALTGCATTASYVNCDNAATVKAAAQATIDAVEYACPI